MELNRVQRRGVTDAADWSQLPDDLLEIILSKSRHATDIFRSEAVCKPWRSGVTEARQRPLFNDILFSPMLLMASHKPDNNQRFFDFSDKKVHHVKLPQVSRSTLITNITQNWFVTFRVHDPWDVTLINPMSPGLQIKLPPGRLYKAVASCNVLDLNCIFMAISGFDRNRLMFCRVGDQSWTTLHDSGDFKDIICYKEEFYVVFGTRLFRCDLGLEPKLIRVTPTVTVKSTSFSYLMELSGDLLQVVRTPFAKGWLQDFKIYKLNFGTGKWDMQLSLGEHSLLVSLNQVVPFSARDLPDFRSNCIYYVERSRYRTGKGARKITCKLCVFNLATMWPLTISPLPEEAYHSFWFLPDIAPHQSLLLQKMEQLRLED